MSFDEIQTKPSTKSSRDGWERVFGGGIPEISKSVKDMLHEWKEAEEYERIILFFMGTCDFSQERSEYLLRELLRGNMNE